MKMQYAALGIVIVVIIFLGAVMLTSKKTHAPAGAKEPAAETVHTLSDLNVTYKLDPELQALYNIEVTSQTKVAGGASDLVQVGGKACNNMSGSFVIIGADEQTDKPVIQTLQDGRRVLDADIVSTLMACLDTTNPKLDDAALTDALHAIGSSIASN